MVWPWQGSLDRVDPDGGDYSFWQHQAADYDESVLDTNSSAMRPTLLRALDATSRQAGQERLLAVDAGCGPGKWLPELAALFSRVIAIDQSPALLARAAKKGGMGAVQVAPALDLARPCTLSDKAGKGHCDLQEIDLGPGADLVTSFNVLLSPDARVRRRIMKRMAGMLKPSKNSTLLMLLPSSASGMRLRSVCRRLVGTSSHGDCPKPSQHLQSLCKQYPDFWKEHPEEESQSIFHQGNVRTQHFTPAGACKEVEAAGLECTAVKRVPYSWSDAFPMASPAALDHKIFAAARACNTLKWMVTPAKQAPARRDWDRRPLKYAVRHDQTKHVVAFANGLSLAIAALLRPGSLIACESGLCGGVYSLQSVRRRCVSSFAVTAWR